MTSSKSRFTLVISVRICRSVSVKLYINCSVTDFSVITSSVASFLSLFAVFSIRIYMKDITSSMSGFVFSVGIFTSMSAKL